jgi:ribokinase
MGRVVVVGSSNTDMTVRLPRLPAPGETVLGDSFATSAGGKGANQAVAARRAGAEVVFVTAVGADELGQKSLELYTREGIDVGYVRKVEGVASGAALIFVGDDGENMIGVASGANHHLTVNDIDRLPDSVFRRGDLLLVSLEIPLETAIRALERGHESGMVTILNPAPAPKFGEERLKRLLSVARVLTPNRGEALAVSGMAEEMTAAEAPDWAACGTRLRSFGPRVVVITLGARGCQVIEERAWAVPAPKVAAVDTVGAGDAFNGALACALSEGRPVDQSVTWASAAAALAVTRPGAQDALPMREAIEGLIRSAGRS